MPPKLSAITTDLDVSNEPDVNERRMAFRKGANSKGRGAIPQTHVGQSFSSMDILVAM